MLPAPARPEAMEMVPPERNPPLQITEALDFLRQQMRSFEIEKAQWTAERNFLNKRITTLEGEKKGHLNLRRDLLRRVRMLEYALRQERSKNVEMQSSCVDASTARKEFSESSSAAHSESTKKTISVLQSYLDQVVPFTPVVALSQPRADLPPPQALPVQQPAKTEVIPAALPPPQEPVALQPEQITVAPVELKVEKKQKPEPKPEPVPGPAPEPKVEKMEEKAPPAPKEAKEDVDIEKMTDEELEAMMAAKMGGKMGKMKGGKREKKKKKKDPAAFNAKDMKKMMSQIQMEEQADAAIPAPKTPEAEPVSLNNIEENKSTEDLGELAGVKVGTVSRQSKVSEISGRKLWKPRWTLRSHFDQIRSVSFHPQEPFLVSGSDDCTVKVWSTINIGVGGGKKTAHSVDVEPMATFRGHVAPVLATCFSHDGNIVASASLDGEIRLWTSPEPDTTPYLPQGCAAPSYRKSLKGHTDAIWSLASSPLMPQIASASADGTVRVWDYSEEDSLVSECQANMGAVTSVKFLPCNPLLIVAAYQNGKICVINSRSGEIEASHDTNCQINSIDVHPTLPMVFLACEDLTVVIFNPDENKVVEKINAHTAAVAGVACDPSGNFFTSCSHDCSLRFWDTETRACYHEQSIHRQSGDAGINAVALHPARSYLATAGADSSVKIFS